MHVHQDERVHEEPGTDNDKEYIDGTRGSREPEDTSQRTEDWRNKTETTEREGLDTID